MPVRNEVAYITQVLEAIYQQDYPADLLEVIVADGLSDDGTLEKINAFIESHPQFKIQVIENRGRIVPTALNQAIRLAQYDVIIRLDAHSVYPNNYISRLVEGLFKYDADNIGGVFRTLPFNGSPVAKAIAYTMSSPFGVGNSYHRIGTGQPCEVDTVPYGCFRKLVFDKIGLFDEELVRNQDDEFNGRMRKNGLKVFMIPDLYIDYYARDSFKKLGKMFYQYGLFKPLTVQKLKTMPSLRQLVPVLFVLFLFGGFILGLLWWPMMVLYVALLLVYAGVIGVLSLKQGLKLAPYVAAGFFIIHVSYGFGYLKGLLALIFGHKQTFKISSISR